MARVLTPTRPRWTRSRLGRVALALLLAALSVLASSPADPKPDRAGLELEAKFTILLGSFIRFPVAKEPSTPFVIAVLGESPFTGELEVFAKGNTIQGRPIRILSCQRVPEGQPCDLLFICRSEWPRVGAIVAWCKGRGVLTVAEGERMAARGVMVNLFVEADRLRLGLNERTLEEEGFTVAANVLPSARILVHGRGPR